MLFRILEAQGVRGSAAILQMMMSFLLGLLGTEIMACLLQHILINTLAPKKFTYFRFRLIKDILNHCYAFPSIIKYLHVLVVDKNCSVKMVGYWPNFFLACLWTDKESRSIKHAKKE